MNVYIKIIEKLSTYLGNCLSLNLLIKLNATPSADIISDAPSGAPRCLFMNSASEYKDAIDIDRPALSCNFEAWLIPMSSNKSLLEPSDKVSGVVDFGLTLVAAENGKEAFSVIVSLINISIEIL